MDIDCWKLFRLPAGLLGGIHQNLKTVAKNLALREQTCSNGSPPCWHYKLPPTVYNASANCLTLPCIWAPRWMKNSGFGSNLAITAVQNQLFWMLQVRYAKQTRQGTTNLTDRGAFDVGEEECDHSLPNAKAKLANWRLLNPWWMEHP